MSALRSPIGGSSPNGLTSARTETQKPDFALCDLWLFSLLSSVSVSPKVFRGTENAKSWRVIDNEVQSGGWLYSHRLCCPRLCGFCWFGCMSTSTNSGYATASRAPYKATSYQHWGLCSLKEEQGTAL